MTISSMFPLPKKTTWPSISSHRQARVCLLLLFFLLGLVFAAWASRIPAVRDTLHLSAGQLGFALLGAGVGGLASFPLAAWMVGRYGQARAALCGGLALLLSLPCIAFSPRLAVLMVSLTLLGAAASCFDVAINAIGAVAEKKAGRSIMSMLHAWFCVGTVTGALSGSLVASQGISVPWHFSMLALVMTAPLWWACRTLEPARAGEVAAISRVGADIDASPCTNVAPVRSTGRTPVFALPPKQLLVLGLLGFCGAIAEGGVADWSGVFMQDRLGASAGLAPLGFAGFTGAMLMARLLADRLKDRFGARSVVAYGGLLAMLGICAAVTATGIAATIAGFALAGAGLAGVFPFVFSAAGREGPTALAGVATISYCGGLVGPPVIGFIAQFAGLQAALGSLGALCAAMALVASRTRSLG